MSETSNLDETIASFALAREGFRDSRYEPDGNVSPDFLIEGNIAVEVRRLNLNDLVNGRPKGREEDIIPLVARLKKDLESYGRRKGNSGSWVFFDFDDERASGSKILSTVRQFIRSEAIYQLPPSERVEICKGVSISTLKSPNLAIEFAFGGNAGEAIWLEHELTRNIAICASDKSTKIADRRLSYPTWWLLLVDYVSYLDGDILADLTQEQVDENLFWDAIWIVSPLPEHKMMRLQRKK